MTQYLINDTISTANSAIGIADTVYSATSIAQKTQNAIDAAVTVNNASILANNTINELIRYSYSPIQSDTLEDALLNLSDGIGYLASAQNISANNVNNPAGISADKTTINTLLSNALLDVGYAAAVIGTLSPSPPQSALTAAANSLNQVNTAQNLITAFDSNPNWNTLSTAIFNVYLAAKYAHTAVYDTTIAYNLNPGSQYANSLGLILYSIFSTQTSDDSINEALSSTSPSTQISFLDSSASFTTIAAQYAKESVYYPNDTVEDTYNFYNNFKTTVSIPQNICSSCCCAVSDTTISSLFYQNIYSFHFCNLKITVEGTIGNLPFTASTDYPTISSFQEFGFNPINLTGNLMLPCNRSDITLREQFNPCYTVKCIYPQSVYNNSNPLTFTADVYSQFILETEIIATKKSSLCALSSDTAVNCQKSVFS